MRVWSDIQQVKTEFIHFLLRTGQREFAERSMEAVQIGPMLEADTYLRRALVEIRGHRRTAEVFEKPSNFLCGNPCNRKLR